MCAGVLPYGLAYLEGKLVVNPTEYKYVLQAVKWWQSGKSFTAIADRLNIQKVKTRLGKRWTHSVVAAMVRRHLNQNEKTKE